MKPKKKTDIDPFEEIMDKVKEEKGYKLDTQLEVEDLQNLVKLFKTAVTSDESLRVLSAGVCGYRPQRLHPAH